MNAPLYPTIRLKDALALLDGPAPVPVQWVKYDRRRGTGGEFSFLTGARLARAKSQAGELRAPTPAEAAAAPAEPTLLVPVPTGNPKNPAHWENATRNLVDTATGTLKKIHIYLLTHVAGRKVYL